MTKDEIYDTLVRYLVDLFEVPEEKITPDSSLVEDLDLDSIDAVDLILELQKLTGRKIAPEEFQSVHVVRDVVEQVHGLLDDTE